MIATSLTTLPAFGPCRVMVGAASAHIRSHETRNAAGNAVLFATMPSSPSAISPGDEGESESRRPPTSSAL